MWLRNSTRTAYHFSLTTLRVPLMVFRLKISFDPSKSDRNLRERGFDFDFAGLIFQGSTIERQDARRDYGEVRIVATGYVGEFALTVVYTERGNFRHVISTRIANRKERREWHAVHRT